MDSYNIDSHKLIYHVDRVNDWLNGKDIFPISFDLGVIGVCNHNCIFCGLDYTRNKQIMPYDVVEKLIGQSARYGVKSIMLAGEGEPLLHKKINDIVKLIKHSGIDISLSTNGVLMDEDFLRKSLRRFTWIRVSLDAGKPSTHAHLHGTQKSDYAMVLNNLEHAVRIKKEEKLQTTIGAQFILLDENAGEAELTAKKLGKIGVDYLSIKPYSKHPLSKNSAGSSIDYSKMGFIKEKVEKFSTKDYKVIFRDQAMRKNSSPKVYNKCLSMPFWAYIAATGDVYGCHIFVGNKKHSFGNLNNDSLYKIWKGAERKRLMLFYKNELNIRNCRKMCRLDSLNEYLWKLKNPHPYVNFI